MYQSADWITQLQSCLGDEISWETGLMDNQAGSSVSKQLLHKRRVFVVVIDAQGLAVCGNTRCFSVM